MNLRKARISVALVAVLALGIGVAVPRLAQAAGESGAATVSSPTVLEGDSGTTPVDVTFTLSAASPNKTTLTYETSGLEQQNGTASSETDYVAQNGSVVFNAGETSKTVKFSVRNDVIKETASETFKVTIKTIDNNYSGVNSFGTVTITDQDVAPSPSVDTKSQDEGSTGGNTPMVFTARLSAPAGDKITYYAFTGDPQHDQNPNQAGNQFLAPKADAGTDYTALTGTPVEFAAGAITATVTVQVKADLIDEADEYFELQLKETNNVNAPIAAYGNGKILDDDNPATLSVDDPSISEGDTTCGGLGDACTNADTHLTFTVTLSPASGRRVVVDYATSDRSATSSTDYNSASGAGDPTATPAGDGLVFAPGETTKTVDVYLKGDDTAEPTERFAFTLTNAVNADIGDGQGFGTILNDDGGTFATMSVGDTTIAENGGNASFTVSVNRTGQLDTATYSVTYTTADGPASEDSTCAKALATKDYTTRTGTATIQWPSLSTTVTVPVLDDLQNEPTECFQLQLNDATNASITDAIGEATITDNDPAPVLAIADKTVAEDTVPDHTAQVTVTLTPASGQVVTVNCATVANSGTADEPEDYLETSRTITFQPGDTSETCDIPVVADNRDENNETLTLALSSPTGNALIGDGTATLTITDDDNPPTVSISSPTSTEGSETDTSAPFTVTLSVESGKPIVVHVATADGSAKAPGDYTATTADITFNPGDKTKDFTVPVKADTIDEVDETFTAVLTNPAASPVTLGTATGTATILDDDALPKLAISDITVTEGNAGTVTATFTVTKTGATEKTVTVHYATGTSGTATSSTDYVAQAGDLSFAPADTTKTIVVQVKGDTDNEPTETFNVDLSAPANATISDGTGIGTITNDDAPPATTTTTTSTSTTTPTSTTSTTLVPGVPAPRITTGPGAGGGPDIRVFNPNGTSGGKRFFDGDETNGKRVARGDLDGDGVDEIITANGPNSSGYVSVYSSNAVLLFSEAPYGAAFRGGVFVATGDVDGDGRDDIITGAGPGGGPHVRTYKYNPATQSPASLTVSPGFYAFAQNFTGGVTVGAADLNADGTDEILTGQATQGNNVRSYGYEGSGSAVKGADFNPYGAFTGGVFVAGGDLDDAENGQAEIVTATGPGGGGDPHLRTFSSSGSPLGAGVYAYNFGFRGGFSVAVGDLDGDGKAEIITGAGPTGGPHVKIWSGGTNGVPQEKSGFFAYDGAFRGGVWVAAGIS